MFFRCTIVLNLALLLGSATVGSTLADESGNSATQKLKNEQEAISGRFARFERVLSQMADMLGYDDPERAELLRRAISLGREQEISSNLEIIARDLEKAEFGSAIEKQKVVTANLKSLLKLLQSEDRMSSVERERERINNLLKDVNNVLLEERAARARAQNSPAPSSAAPAQQEALKKTDKILDDIDKHDNPGESETPSDSEASDGSLDQTGKDQSKSSGEGQDPKDSNGKEGDGSKEEDKPSEKSESGENPGKQTDGNKTEGQGEDSDDKPSDAKPDDQKPGSESDGKGEPSESKPSDSQSSESQSSESQTPPSDQNSDQPPENAQEEETKGKENIDAARNMMQEALDLLKQQKKEQAIDKQDKAITELQKAAEELEKMLNQLREEEKEMTLASLEARFQRLLAMETQILESTTDLASTPREEWLDNAVSACRALGIQQTEAARECSYVTSLLREDGTSVSILVAVEDIEFDMAKIAERLQQTKADSLTRSMESDVVEALKELVETTQKEMAEMKQQQQQPQQGSQQEKPDLVNLMQEIKMLRSLQVRVNRRTAQVNDLFQDATPTDARDLQDQLSELAIRQQRLVESAAELAKKMEEQR